MMGRYRERGVLCVAAVGSLKASFDEGCVYTFYRSKVCWIVCVCVCMQMRFDWPNPANDDQDKCQ